MAKRATSVRCVTQSDGTVPRVGLRGVAGTPPCSRMLQVDSGVRLQRFSASTWSFLDFACSQVGDLISINLFWGKTPAWRGSGGTGAAGDMGGHRAAQGSGQWGQLQASTTGQPQALPAYSGFQAPGNSDVDSSLPHQLACYWCNVFEWWNNLFFPNTRII